MPRYISKKMILSSEQLHDLNAYIEAYGSTWKSSLCRDWNRGGGEREFTHNLYRLRATHGPRWLNNYSPK